MPKKITLATIKSFIRKNRDNLYFKSRSHFDGMVDMVTPTNGSWSKAEPSRHSKLHHFHKNTLGVEGAWFVLQSNDYFRKIDDGEFEGYEIFNCCGCFNLGIKKEAVNV